MKTYKHKTTGETMTYQNGVMQVGRIVIEGEPNLDFWEEVVKKDYEILSIISTENPITIITYENGGGNYTKEVLQKTYKNKDYFVSYFISYGNPWKIHSVKRLSDGEIFSIGDKISSSSFSNPSDADIINEFYIPDEKFCKMWSNRFTINDLIIRTNKSWQSNLHHATKYKQLFTTFDGVPIYECNTNLAWVINGEYKYELTVCEKNYKSCLLKNEEIYKVFSTKEKAEKWCAENRKPICVTEDNIELYGGESVYGVTDNLQIAYTSVATKENVQRCKIFVRKENAEKYIKENEKRYSLNDIKETVNKLGCFGTTLIEYLEKNGKAN